MSDEGDGVWLMATAHPVASWRERIYWRCIIILRWFRDLYPPWRPYETVQYEIWRDTEWRLRVRKVRDE